MSRNIIADAEFTLLRSLANSEIQHGLSYGKVRDYAEGTELFAKLLCYNGDIKDLQRYWMLKTILSTQPIGATLLEIGAGEPLIADILGRLGYRVIVVDPYEGAGNGPTELDHFRRSYQNVEFIVDWFSDKLSSVQPGSVDCCYSISVIEHVPVDKLSTISDAIKLFTAPNGSSIHAIDVVSLGSGDQYHRGMYLNFSELLGYEDSEAVASLEKAAGDPDTYFLSAEAHNRWRGAMPYDEFPMRRVQSMQIVGFGKKKHIKQPLSVNSVQNSAFDLSPMKADLQKSLSNISELYSLVGRYEQSGHRCLRKAAEAIKQNTVLSPHVPVRLFNGSVMNINLREEVGGIIFEFGAYEFDLTRFVVQFLREGDVFFDVGAHYGYFSVLASGIVGASGKIFSFEPTDLVADQLRSNVLHLGNVVVCQTAIGDKNGELEFNDYGADFSAFNSIYGARLVGQKRLPQRRVTVPVSRLESFCDNSGIKPDLIKIDTESSEMLVLAGMGKLLGETRALIVELGDFDELNAAGVPRSAEILEFIRSQGYRLFMPSNGELIDHEILSTKYDYCNVICIKKDDEFLSQTANASA